MKFKKPLIIILIFVIALAGIFYFVYKRRQKASTKPKTTLGTQEDPTKNWSLYEDNYFHWKIKYPPNWLVDKSYNPLAPKVDQSITFIPAGQENQKDGDKTKIFVNSYSHWDFLLNWIENETYHYPMTFEKWEMPEKYKFAFCKTPDIKGQSYVINSKDVVYEIGLYNWPPKGDNKDEIVKNINWMIKTFEFTPTVITPQS